MWTKLYFVIFLVYVFIVEQKSFKSADAKTKVFLQFPISSIVEQNLTLEINKGRWTAFDRSIDYFTQVENRKQREGGYKTRTLRNWFRTYPQNKGETLKNVKVVIKVCYCNNLLELLEAKSNFSYVRLSPNFPVTKNNFTSQMIKYTT